MRSMIPVTLLKFARLWKVIDERVAFGPPFISNKFTLLKL